MTRRTVYVLQSEAVAGDYYVGLTSDVARRLAAHNAGGSRHTSRSRPWRVLATVELASEDRAARFEKYLKSGSGRAFVRRHFR
jgi:predicted GIY-YIG superfamily endonuclease